MSTLPTNRTDAIKQHSKRYNTGKPCKNGHYADRLSGSASCIVCLSEDRKRHMKNPKFAAKVAKTAKQWRTLNNSKMQQLHRDWKLANRAYATAKEVERYATKLRAKPVWSETNQINELYEAANYLSRLTGVQWDVDHECPLQSSIVCGLHVFNNLQLLPHTDNIRKSNHFTPQFV